MIKFVWPLKHSPRRFQNYKVHSRSLKNCWREFDRSTVKMYIQSTLLSHLNFLLKKEKYLYKQILPRPQAKRGLFYHKMIQSCTSVSKLKLIDNFLMSNWMWTYFENFVSGASLNDKSYTVGKNCQKVSETQKHLFSSQEGEEFK